MVTTTSYGTWNNHIHDLSAGLNADVIEALGDYAGDYDTDAIATEWHQAINAALPAGVALCGDEFIGPAYAEDKTWTGELDLKAIVESIDFWAIAARHDKTA